MSSENGVSCGKIMVITVCREWSNGASWLLTSRLNRCQWLIFSSSLDFFCFSLPNLNCGQNSKKRRGLWSHILSSNWRSFKPLIPPAIPITVHSYIERAFGFPDILFPTFTARYQIDHVFAFYNWCRISVERATGYKHIYNKVFYIADASYHCSLRRFRFGTTIHPYMKIMSLCSL